MDQIAFILGERFLYWGPIILMMACLTGVAFFWAFYLGKSGNAMGAACAVPLAMVLSLVLARLVHWYCRGDSYAGISAALTDLTSGGYALLGAFAGCLLTALILRFLRIIRDLPEMLDAMSLAGCAAISLGRLACLFSTADRGQIVSGITTLPWVYPVTNAVSGAVEYRLATFALQSIACAVIFVSLTLLYLVGNARKKLRSGDVTLLFLLLYGASQVVLDSTRYDSLFLRSNGFVSVVQILSAVAIVVSLVVFSVRMVRSNGWKPGYLGLWLVTLGLMGGAGYMEYHVQRHGNEAVFAYSVMSTCLVLVAALIIVMRAIGLRGENRQRTSTIYSGLSHRNL